MLIWFQNVLETIGINYSNPAINLTEIVAMLIVILFLSLYEFLVYRVVSHRAFYNMSFHISIMIIPFFIGAIVKSLQSNLVITLGTIGALAIIRYRTAIKDPIDMIYILWSVFIGISCGCSLYELCVIVSVAVTIVLIFFNLLGHGLFKNPYYLVVNCDSDMEEELKKTIKEKTKSFRLKSRNYTSNGVDYVYEINIRKPKELTDTLNSLESIKQFSLIEYDSNDII